MAQTVRKPYARLTEADYERIRSLIRAGHPPTMVAEIMGASLSHINAVWHGGRPYTSWRMPPKRQRASEKPGKTSRGATTGPNRGRSR